MREQLKRPGFLDMFLFLSLLCVGLFHVYLSCIASVALLAYISVKALRTKRLEIYINTVSVAVLVLVAAYAVSGFWAVDAGMAPIGFMKLLPAVLYLIALMQQKEEISFFETLPFAAAFMTVISAIGSFIPAVSSLFTVAGRLAGFFQYPNTFAIFLLVAELIVLSRPKYKCVDFILLAILISGILYTGSRTVFVFMIISNLAVLLTGGNKRVRLIVLAALALAVAAVAVYFMITGSDGALGRFLTLSLKESTFVGRILYCKDALPLLIKHPFGLGYMGYYYTQRSVQTGVYSVMFIHNDFVQIMLDVGLIPFLLFAAALVRSVISKSTDARKRIIICTIAAHCCFDFDLQFTAMLFILLHFTDYKSGKRLMIDRPCAVTAACSVLAVVSVYFAVFLALSRFGCHKAAHGLYPWNTQNEEALLISEKDIDAADEMADRIIGRNPYVTVAYSVKARYAYSKGDFGKVIEYKHKIFENAPFAYEEYEEYCYMLINGVMLYDRAGDEFSVKVCTKELISTKNAVESIESKLSDLGKSIKDQPVKELPEEINRYIAGLEDAE